MTYLQILLTCLILVFISSCNRPPSLIMLDVSRNSGDGVSCKDGLQATLTVFSDMAVIASPKLTEVEESFQDRLGKVYSSKETVKIEAHCYEADGLHGQIIVEGEVANFSQWKGTYHRNFSVSLPYFDGGSDLSSPDDCINKDKVHVKIISSLEPIPCISPYGFRLDEE